ncbi:syntaxin 5-like protein [Scheffersomyces stipitis CBS 6054]|uniref:Protein transport protein SFT2 n=1 Tax=Scheffersomyces stipitis (strain ATCC 58785 / CBS 6054 / NBRC 10063 / NRRL Y-11545) TaxID=322104 RepID=A3LQG7_PICST|nr:syntaxin 5-like protein [Scheffersomyces stipitis CBS 6054]ABN64678.2 syntaxin 5-like protein [Scheffersomyces stipitis CBS 6054]KAG2736474.1 hypothetical protein G9P44_000564 [Scheffersomyces stipitis]
MSESENVFRQSFNNWNSRPAAGAGAATSGSRPVLSDWTDYVRSGATNLYNQLPLSAQDANNANTQSQEPAWFTLTRFEKLVGFSCCLAASVLCFVLCFFMFPVLALRPRKFGLLWTMGSVLFVVSFGVLQGPYSYTRHLLSRDRVLFTGIFFGSVLLTLYSAVIVRSSLMTILASLIETLAIIYYTISYFPFGSTTLTWFTSYFVGYLGGLVGGVIL